MTSVPPTQPPAAPEADVRLTEAERDDLIRAFFDQDHDCAHNMTDAYRLVERIVAERLRVVEGERDFFAAEADEWKRQADINLYRKRLESAEADHAALAAERDEAWRVAAQRRNDARRYYVAWQVARMRARSLRALLASEAR